jgi:hypothetical protein
MAQTTTKFIVTQPQITCFLESQGRIDFLIQAPHKADARCTAIASQPKDDLVIDDKSLVIKEMRRNAEGVPHQLVIELDGQTLVLGRRFKAAGAVSFFRTLGEPEGAAPAPTSDEEILAAFAGFTFQAKPKRKSRTRAPVIVPDVPEISEDDLPF